MRLLVYMRDGRTVYYITGRANLRALLTGEPWHENGGVNAARGIWNPGTGEYVWTRGIHLRHLAKGSIGIVEEGSPNEVAAPA